MERVSDVPGSCKVTEMDRLSSKREVNLLNEQERVREAAHYICTSRPQAVATGTQGPKTVTLQYDSCFFRYLKTRKRI